MGTPVYTVFSLIVVQRILSLFFIPSFNTLTAVTSFKRGQTDRQTDKQISSEACQRYAWSETRQFDWFNSIYISVNKELTPPGHVRLQYDTSVDNLSGSRPGTM